MKQVKFVKFIVFAISLVIFFACSEQGEKKQQQESKKTDDKQQVEKTKADPKTEKTNTNANATETKIDGMSNDEAEVLDMMKTAYEQNAEDLINWSDIAAKVVNVNQAYDAMYEYIEVQKRFNKKLKEVEDYSVKKLGEDYEYSLEYETAFKLYLSDPARKQRSNRAVNSTMRLIDLYGKDAKFMEIMEKIGEMNRHKMKELNSSKDEA